MVFPIMRNNKPKKNALLNTNEAFSLWEMLNSKYAALEKLAVWSSFSHDKDLTAYLHSYTKTIEGFVKTLENALHRYGIKGPDCHVLTANSAVNSDIIRDQLIATHVLEA